MKQFEIPTFYRSPLIQKLKAQRKLEDPRKKDFSPTRFQIGQIEIILSRHFGFCYGVENAIEIAYKAIQQHPDKKIYLLSQMIHNPEVNEDLLASGIQFIQDTEGKQLIPWSAINKDDIVLIPAFGTTLEIKNKLHEIGVDIDTYNTTCPFVEKVWNRSEKLNETDHTVIIHGKANHEETRATFSHASKKGPSLIVKDMEEAQLLVDFIQGTKSEEFILDFFKGKYSEGFSPEHDLKRIGVVNQTTMLATETQAITDLIRQALAIRYGEGNLKTHMADTRDTLCYATNDNQSATLSLLKEDADFALVVGGYNSSNTSHLVEILEEKFTTYFIRTEENIADDFSISSFNIHTKELVNSSLDSTQKRKKIILTSGASCPDSIIERIIYKLVKLYGYENELNQWLNQLA